jgi:hypothetical protein
MADEEAQTNGETGLDLLQARQVLLANSAKQRVAELNDIHERLTRQGENNNYDADHPIKNSDHPAQTFHSHKYFLF